MLVMKPRALNDLGKSLIINCYNLSHCLSLAQACYKINRNVLHHLLWDSPCGNFALSISKATMLIIRIQIGESRSSGSFFTKLIAVTHWDSNLKQYIFVRTITSLLKLRLGHYKLASSFMMLLGLQDVHTQIWKNKWNKVIKLNS